MVESQTFIDNREITNIEKYIKDIKDNEIYLDRCFPHNFVEKYIIIRNIIIIKQAIIPFSLSPLLRSHPPHPPSQQHLQQQLLH